MGNKTFRTIIVTMAVIIATSCSAAGAPDKKSGLGGLLDGLGTAGSTIGNLVEGVFTKSDLTVEDIAGTWTSDGSAVSFKSDNFLKQAGGVAAAAAVEAKLDPYYKQYGLTGSTLTINQDGTFELGIKKMTVKGTIARKDKGIFTMKFQAFGGIGLGSMDAYVEKSINSVNVMFDADKIKKLISFAATLSGSTMASTAGKVLESYDGMCIGFKMTKTAEDGSKTTKTDAAVDALKGLFGK